MEGACSCCQKLPHCSRCLQAPCAPSCSLLSLVKMDACGTSYGAHLHMSPLAGGMHLLPHFKAPYSIYPHPAASPLCSLPTVAASLFLPLLSAGCFLLSQFTCQKTTIHLPNSICSNVAPLLFLNKLLLTSSGWAAWLQMMDC